MAYQTRQRDPLLDSQMQAALERRGKEVLGLVLIAIGVALSLILISYSPEDPNWSVATDAVPENYLGHIGASLAAILMLIVGYGAYGLALGALVWGLRFILHRGADRALGRVVFLPIAVALASIYAASYAPGASWTHSFGLGGLFGDTVLGALLNVLPIGSVFGLKLLAALSFFACLALGLFVLGVNGSEMRLGLRFLLVGLIATIAGLAAFFGRASRGAGQAAQSFQSRRRDVAEAATEEEPPIVRRAEPRLSAVAAAAAPARTVAAPPAEAEPEVEPAPRPSFLERLRARAAQPAPEPELLEREPVAGDEIDAPTDDRIREKIADVIKARVRRPLTAPEAAVARHRAAAATPAPSPQHRVEPPLTAPAAPPVARETAPEEIIPVPHSERVAELDAEPSRAAGFVVPPSEPRKVVQHSTKKSAPSRAAMADAQPSLPLEAEKPVYEFPPLSLLTNPVTIERHHLSDEALEENARMLENVLDDYGVKGEIVSVRPGPVVTMYELEPAPGLKASRVIGLADDIARSMSALSARVSTVPGRSVIGIELPNQHREKVVLREILSARDFGDGNQRLPLALGKDIGGDPVVANLAKMPHLLIAGTTGSGKSVAINTMIMSLLYKLSPEDCRMIMIDPKMLELSVYDGIPHLLSPVVTDPKKAVVALKWVVGEMEERYRKMSKMGVRNIDGYNGRVRDALEKGEMFSRTVQTGFDEETGEPIFETEEFAPEKMPFIVVIVDEMADLMMVAGKEIEACIQRLAQMARASGIHIIMATQRPSVDVITGTIKANFPTRISFHVTSKVDSRTILGEMGAEQLLGMGDMLYMAGGAKITRVHGPFVSDEEVEEIVRHLKSFGPPDYAASVLDGPDDEKEADIDMVLGLGGNTDGEDALYDQAVQIVIQDRKCSTSYIQRKLAIGYNKAARLVEQMEENGLVSPANHVGKRDILVPEQAG